MSVFARLGWSRRLASRVVLGIGLPAAFAVALWMGPRQSPPKSGQSGEGDLGLFKAVVSGERLDRDYYEVYGAESRTRGYPTRSVFNWRQPLLMRSLAMAPYAVGVAVFVALALFMVLQAHPLLRRELLWVLTMLNAAMVTIIPGGVYFTESWAGLCLGLSAIAYARRRETTGATWALLALFIRELSAVYCVIAVLIALRQKRWKEVGVWMAGGILYAAYLGVHVWRVMHHILPGDRAHGHSWLYGGGLPFVLKVWQVNGVLIGFPVVAFALVVAAGVAAWWAPRMPVHVRANVIAYSVLFLFVGLPFNTYWGELIAPLAAMWLAYAPAGLGTLWDYAELPRDRPHLTFKQVHALVLNPRLND